MISKNPRSAFAYCTHWDFESICEALDKGNKSARVCFVTTQAYRLYVFISANSLKLIPCVRSENQWITVSLLNRVTVPSAEELFSSVEHMKDSLTELFFRQFPIAEESFFTMLPTAKEVTGMLTSSPYGRTMAANFLVYSQDGETFVEEADGVVSILTEEGNLMIPYDKVTEDGIYDIKLQMYRAKLHPDSYIEYFGNKIWECTESFSSVLRELSWSRFRRFVDRVIK